MFKAVKKKHYERVYCFCHFGGFEMQNKLLPAISIVTSKLSDT